MKRVKVILGLYRFFVGMCFIILPGILSGFDALILVEGTAEVILALVLFGVVGASNLGTQVGIRRRSALLRIL